MKKFLKNYGSYILIVLIVVLLRTYIVTPIRVNGDSMNKTLKDGWIMLLLKNQDIQSDDIIVISKKLTGENLIKRVIALPGETISCENGIIYVNGKKYDDKYAYGKTSDFEKVILKDDEYFVLGDNREISYDSRSFGVVSKKYISGKTSIVLFPFTKIGKVN